MADLPFSEAHLNYSIPDLVDTGKKWRNVDEDLLVGICGRQMSAWAHVIEGARAELSRRSVDAQRTLEAAVRESTEVYSKHARRLEELTIASAKQTDKVIDLTKRLRTLTVVITGLTVAAVVFGGIQAVAILVHFYRWYRGWL